MATNDFYFQFEQPKQQPEKKLVTGTRLVLGYIGIFLITIGFFVLLPLIMLAFYPKEWKDYLSFLIPGGTSLGLGRILVLLIFKKPTGKRTSLQALGMLVGIWILAILASAVPYLFFGYTFNQALYESASGYATAGLTIIDFSKELYSLPNGTTDVYHHCLFFHRALTQFVGGIGLVLTAASAFSESSGLNLYQLEGHNDKLLPNLAKSARLIFSIYLAYRVFGRVLYISFGVKPFDALCHSITALATGGFSTKANSINSLSLEVSLNGQWRGIAIEIVTEVLRLLGATNFRIHYSLFKRKFKILRHFEFVVFFLILLLVWPFIIAGFSQYFGGNVAAGFRYGTFERISALAGAGFQSVDSYQAHAVRNSAFASSSSGFYGFTSLGSLTPVMAIQGYTSGQRIRFPTDVIFLLTVLRRTGGQNGSTSGAIKQHRIGLALGDILFRIKASQRKNGEEEVQTIYKYGVKTRVTKEEVSEAWTYIASYTIVTLSGALLMALIAKQCNWARGDRTGDAFTFSDCLFDFASAIGGVGLSTGIINYSRSRTAPGIAVLYIEMVGRLLGRLELFVYVSLFGKRIRSLKNRKNSYSKKNLELAKAAQEERKKKDEFASTVSGQAGKEKDDNSKSDEK